MSAVWAVAEIKDFFSCLMESWRSEAATFVQRLKMSFFTLATVLQKQNQTTCFIWLLARNCLYSSNLFESWYNMKKIQGSFLSVVWWSKIHSVRSYKDGQKTGWGEQFLQLLFCFHKHSSIIKAFSGKWRVCSWINFSFSLCKEAERTQGEGEKKFSLWKSYFFPAVLSWMCRGGTVNWDPYSFLIFSAWQAVFCSLIHL